MRYGPYRCVYGQCTTSMYNQYVAHLVVRPEVVPPLTHAVRLIHYDAGQQVTTVQTLQVPPEHVTPGGMK